jgi:GTP cyclohydrolase I
MTSDDSAIASAAIEEQIARKEDHDHTIDWEKAQKGARLLLESIGEDPKRKDLIETWQRRVPDALATLSEGRRQTAKPTMRTFEANADELVVKTGIPVYSLCEHHLLPYHGVAHVAYLPKEEVAGLSKLSRYVRWQSRRLTMQEELTSDLADGLADELNANAMLVELSATHLCEAMRGVETETTTTTRAVVGDPSNAERARFSEAITQYDQS